MGCLYASLASPTTWPAGCGRSLNRCATALGENLLSMRLWTGKFHQILFSSEDLMRVESWRSVCLNLNLILCIYNAQVLLSGWRYGMWYSTIMNFLARPVFPLDFLNWELNTSKNCKCVKLPQPNRGGWLRLSSHIARVHKISWKGLPRCNLDARNQPCSCSISECGSIQFEVTDNRLWVPRGNTPVVYLIISRVQWHQCQLKLSFDACARWQLSVASDILESQSRDLMLFELDAFPLITNDSSVDKAMLRDGELLWESEWHPFSVYVNYKISPVDLKFFPQVRKPCWQIYPYRNILLQTSEISHIFRRKTCWSQLDTANFQYCHKDHNSRINTSVIAWI